MSADYTPTPGTYTELKPFRFWCQKVLPLVYDDTLSYYELLCKVVDYLNKTMEDVDTLHDDVENLHAAYVQLQTYVNNYFDNLDIQQEINNKLDEMATDGTLVAILQPTVADEVAAWMAEHITPTTPSIDNTLLVSGAGADSKKTGDALAATFSTSDTYQKNDIKKYSGSIYQAVEDLTAGSWNSSKWVNKTLADMIARNIKAIKAMNDTGVVDFAAGDMRMFNGYYSGVIYNGDGNEIFTRKNDWFILLVHVVKGKTINISGMPSAVGAQSVWLNSPSLTDVEAVAWHAQQCNGSHLCITEWLAMSGFKTYPENVKILYNMREDLQQQATDNNTEVLTLNKALLNCMLRQYVTNDALISGYYYGRNSKNTSSGTNVYILPPFRIMAGVDYSFVKVYGYFCTIFFDDGTSVSISDTSETNTTANITPSKNGWCYATIHGGQIGSAVIVAGKASYAARYFEGEAPDPEAFPLAPLKVKNALLAVSNAENISRWGEQHYTVSGNSVIYTAPLEGNAGFYISPFSRRDTGKIKVKINVAAASVGSGTMTAHIWDTITASFADHLYTVRSFSNSISFDIDFSAVTAARPNFDTSKWVLLISNSTNNFTMTFDSIEIFYNDSVPDNVDGETLGAILSDIYTQLAPIPKYVECGAGKPYTRLRDAIAAAETVRGSKVIVYPGVYDLTTEFATEIAAASHSTGILLTNDVYVLFLPGSYVKALFPASSEWISNNFQPFYAGGSGFTLDGLNIEASNCRYCVHDERGGQDVKYHNVYKNCIMKFTMDDPQISGGTNHYIQCIGGGFGKYGYVEIIGGYYETVNNLNAQHQEPITFHNGVSDGCDNRLFITDVYLADGGYIRIGCYGPSTIKSKVFVSGCSMYNDVYKMYEVPASYEVDNFDIVKWNNTIRSGS